MVIQDEQKFQDYFLKKNKKVERKVYLSPVSQKFELIVNRDIIENSQEMIIEEEEFVPMPQIPRQKYVKSVRTRISKLVNPIRTDVFLKL